MTAWISLVMLSVLAVSAENGPAEGKGMRQRGAQDINRFVAQVIEAVDATQEQAAQLEAIAKEHQEAVESMRDAHADQTDEERAQVRDLHRQVREARRDGDDAQVEKLQGEIHEIMGANPRDLLEQTHAKIAAVLTAEQQPAFQELLKTQRDSFRRGAGRQGRGGPGGPEGRRGQGLVIERFIARVIEVTDATPEQQVELKKIGAEHADAVKEARAQAVADRKANAGKIRSLREEMGAAIEDGDEEAVQELRAQMRTLMGGSTEELFQQTVDKIAKVMTKEQQPAYDELVAETRERLEQRPILDERGPRGRGPGGPGFRGRGPGQGPPDQPVEEDE